MFEIKKIIRIMFVVVLVVFSFFYTDKVIDFIRNTDPIMKNIKEKSKKYEVKATDAKICKNKIIPGINGKKVDYKSSYKKMKQYGKYNESLTVFEETTPAISIDDYYDKYISQGSGINNDISLVFFVNKSDDITDIVNILIEKNVRSTFFVDGLYLENNQDIISIIAEEGNEVEILNYDNRYNLDYFNNSLNLAYEITNIKPKYCIAKYDNKEVLELCQKLNLHTIIPTIITGNYPFNDIKKKINRGSIISFDMNSSTKIELPAIIDYIRQKGYIIDTLDNLLSEASNLK